MRAPSRANFPAMLPEGDDVQKRETPAPVPGLAVLRRASAETQVRMAFVKTTVMAMALAAGAHAGGTEQLHRFGNWSVVTWSTPAGRDVYWAQTLLDSKHLVEEEDGDHLRFGCSAASRPMTKLLLAEGRGSAHFTDSYTVDWRVGNLPPISRTGKRMTLFDLFDAPEATKQLLEGERANDSLVLRLSNPDTGTTGFQRRLVGTAWPKLYVAQLDGFRQAHDFVVEKCKEERAPSTMTDDTSFHPETTLEGSGAPSGAPVVQRDEPRKEAGATDSVRRSAIARCREAMGDYGSAMVKACADQDLAAYAALSRYSGHQATINRCRRDMQSYGWAMVKACVDQDIESEQTLGD